MKGLKVAFLTPLGVRKQSGGKNVLLLGGVLVGLVEVAPAMLEYSATSRHQ